MRLFAAINLPEELKSRLAGAVGGINAAGLKKVGPENLHLTMKFLGEVDEKKVEFIKQKLGEIKAEPFKVSLGGIGFFPNEDYIKVVWVGVSEGGQEIINLQKEMDSKLSEIGFAKEKNFEPHLTIARVNFLKDKVGLKKMLQMLDFSGGFEARSFDLMQSTLTPKGPVYEKLREFLLE